MLDKVFLSRNQKQKKESKKQDKPQQKAKEPFLTERHLALCRNILLLLAILLDLYFIASYFSFYTGKVGYFLHKYIILYGGGGAIIPLTFGLYCFFALLIKKPLPHFFRQLTATVLVYFALSLALHLYKISGFPVPIKLRPWMMPGLYGQMLSNSLLKFAGLFGTILLGFAAVFIALWFLDFISYENIKLTMESLFEKVQPPKRESQASPQQENCRSVGNTNSPKEVKDVVVRKHKGREVSQILVVEENSIECPSSLEVVDKDKIAQQDNESELSLTNEVEQGLFPPPLDILGPETFNSDKDLSQELIDQKSDNIIDTLKEFNIEAQMAEVVVGPTVIQFRLQLAPGIKVSKVAALTNDLAVALGVTNLRVEAPIPGTTYVGVEIPNPKRRPVHLRSIIQHKSFGESEGELPLAIGTSVDGRHLTVPLEKLPHLLVAGTTGSGKSVFISSCITSLCYARRPEEMRLLLIDPKRVEMKIFEKLPHTLMPPVVESKKAVHALAWAVSEMERRYEKFAQARARDLKAYNAKVLPKDRLPYIVIVIDELADLMFTSPKEVEDYICRLAQMARATGMHLIIATQRPSVNVVTGLIKANIPARVAFTLPSQTDSRTVIDIAGAEKLLGSGDMLFLTPRLSKPVRMQAPMINEATITNFIEYLVRLFGEPEYIDIDTANNNHSNEVVESYDPLLEQALEIIMQTGIASASRLQRQLRIGFTRAARLIDTLESLGIVSAPDGAKPRDILVDLDEAKQILEEHLKRDNI